MSGQINSKILFSFVLRLYQSENYLESSELILCCFSEQAFTAVNSSCICVFVLVLSLNLCFYIFFFSFLWRWLAFIECFLCAWPRGKCLHSSFPLVLAIIREVGIIDHISQKRELSDRRQSNLPKVTGLVIRGQSWNSIPE